MNDQDHDSTIGRWARAAGIFLLVVVGLILLIQLLFTFVAEPMLKDKIRSAAASHGFTAKTDDFSLSLLQRQLKAEGLTIYDSDSLSDTTNKESVKQSTSPLDSLAVKHITVSGIHFFNYFFNNEIKVNQISISRPFLQGSIPSTPKESGSTGNKGNSSLAKKDNKSGPASGSHKKTLYDRVKSFADAVEVGEFSIQHSSAQLQNDSTGELAASVANLSLEFQDIVIDSVAPRYQRMPASSLQGSLDSLYYKMSRFYSFHTDHFSFSSSDSLLTIKNFSLEPRLPKYEFSQAKGKQTNRIDLEMANLQFSGINIPALVENKSLQANAVQLEGSELEVFFNKMPPSGIKTKKKFPHLAFRQMSFPVAIDSAVISDADITYGEHKNMVPQPGTIRFENTNAVIRNLYNQASEQEVQAITANANSKIMGEGDIQVSFNFPVNPDGTHYIDGSVGPMPFEALNPTLKYLAMVQVSEGQLKDMSFQMELGPRSSTGRVLMHYKNLTFKVISFGNEGGKRSADLKSFAADLVVEGSNIPPLRVGDISFQRVTTKGIFNYWWKSLLSGIKSSITI